MQVDNRERRLNDWLSRHQGLVIKVARSFARETHDRDDLLQEIAFQLWQSIPGYRSQVAETTWIYRVAFYTAINWSRKEEHRKQRNCQLGEQALGLLSKQVDEDPRVAWLYERIAELDPVDRSLTLLLLDGFSYREMSETLGISESSVGVRIHRIKKSLTNQLTRENQHVL